MIDRRYDAVVVGAGSAGLTVAARIAREGLRVAVFEREIQAGGILNQCIHSGFGLHRYKEDLTGPEYAERLIDALREPLASGQVDLRLDTTVLEASPAEGHTLFAYSPREGVTRLSAGAIVLAMGCRERNRGAIGIPGSRPAGIYTAGLAQRLINIDGYIPGRRAVILGSGDIGLIMARRLTWVGVEVLGVVEIQPYPSGLTRNIVQCLNDFRIPLYLSHQVTEIRGRERLTAVEVSPLVDGQPDAARSFVLECDTLLLSVGLIPDNELSKKLGVALSPETGGPVVDGTLMSSVAGVFACGNVLHVHDLVDWVSEEADACGTAVVEYLRGRRPTAQLPVAGGANVRYVVPNRWVPGRVNRFYLRSLVVKNQAELSVTLGGQPIKTRRLAHVQPSEMVSFTLEAADLPAAAERSPEAGEARLEVSIR